MSFNLLKKKKKSHSELVAELPTLRVCDWSETGLQV